jgi:hypothetical protein
LARDGSGVIRFVPSSSSEDDWSVVFSGSTNSIAPSTSTNGRAVCDAAGSEACGESTEAGKFVRVEWNAGGGSTDAEPDVLSVVGTDVGKELAAVLTSEVRTPVTIASDGLFVWVTETAGSVAGEELAVSRTTEVRCACGYAVVGKALVWEAAKAAADDVTAADVRPAVGSAVGDMLAVEVDVWERSVVGTDVVKLAGVVDEVDPWFDLFLACWRRWIKKYFFNDSKSLMWYRLGLLFGSGGLKVDNVTEVSVVLLLKNAVVGVVMNMFIVVTVTGFVTVVEVCLVAFFVAGLLIVVAAVAAVFVADIVGEADVSGGM